MPRGRSRFYSTGLGLLGLLVALGAAGCSVLVPGRAEPPPTGPGVAVGYEDDGRELDTLGPVWYMDYDFRTRTWLLHPRLYFIQLSTPPEQVAQKARTIPGQWWTFGNEPNDVNQDNIPPDAYVPLYHALDAALRAADPQAHLIPTGVADANWHWLDEWREKYRQAYGRYPQVDGWRYHNYLLETCEGATDAAEFKRRALEFRAWVDRIGDGARPILLTEYGVLYGNGCCRCPLIPQEQVIDYMRATTEWLMESHAVTAWAWFALDTNNRYNGDLFRGPQMLPTGAAYQQLLNAWRRQQP